MRIVKETVSMLLVLSIAVGFSACGKKTAKQSTAEIAGGYNSGTQEDYNNTVSEWGKSGISQIFENSVSCATAATPGLSGEKVSLLNNPSYAEGDEESLSDRGFTTSILGGNDTLRYFYEGKNYAYGINQNGTEYIAYKSPSGEMLDAVTGAGKFVINTTSGAASLVTGNVSDFSETMKDGYTSLVVTYLTSGAAAYRSVQTTYIFKDNGISVSSQVTVKDGGALSCEKSRFIRGFVNGYRDYEIKVNSKWVYPDDGDFPYPDFESLCYKHKLNDDIYMYSYMRADGIPTLYQTGNLRADEMTMDFDSATGLFYTLEYDMTFVDTVFEYQQGADYRALFKSMASDFAAGVAPVNEQADNSTLFIGNEVKLNLNVTNLTESDLKFSLRYDVRDYYGNIVDKGLFIDSTVYSYTGANRVIDIKGLYGIYYLNLYVISRYSSYSECYPFALLEEHTYNYNATSPFGVNSANTKNATEVANTAKIYAKIGAATARVNSNMVSLADELVKNGITQINGIMGSPFEITQDYSRYPDKADEVLSQLSPYIDSFEFGNEMNLLVLNGKKTMEEVYSVFYNNTFDPIRKLLNVKYPGIDYIPSPFSAGQQEWIDQLTKGYDVDTDGDGITEHLPEVWSKLSVVSTHLYGQPWMPDEYSTYAPEYKKALWCIEAGLQRLDECFNNYCANPDEKDLYVTEIGYATSAGDPVSLDLRTHADYSIRCLILCSAYGADRIQLYCMYDRSQAKSGFYNKEIEDEALTMNEYNFGLFYEADYYGRFMPKPAAIAFANITRQLEDINKNSMCIYDKYDEGYDYGGVRAFKCTTADSGSVVIAYSNAEVVPNGKKNADGLTGLRKPNLPWQNQWKTVDNTVFTANSSTVRVVDIMGNTTEYTAKNGEVTIPLTGSPVYIYGVK